MISMAVMVHGITHDTSDMPYCISAVNDIDLELDLSFSSVIGRAGVRALCLSSFGIMISM